MKSVIQIVAVIICFAWWHLYKTGGQGEFSMLMGIIVVAFAAGYWIAYLEYDRSR